MARNLILIVLLLLPFNITFGQSSMRRLSNETARKVNAELRDVERELFKGAWGAGGYVSPNLSQILPADDKDQRKTGVTG